MALPDLYSGGVVANVSDPPQISLVKLVALLRESAIGSTTGTTGIARSNSSALEKSRVVKDTAGTLFSTHVYNTGAADFLQIFDSATLPADGTFPLISLPIGANSSQELLFGENGMPFTTGLVVALSTTDDQLTLIAADEAIFLSTYR